MLLRRLHRIIYIEILKQFMMLANSPNCMPLLFYSAMTLQTLSPYLGRSFSVFFTWLFLKTLMGTSSSENPPEVPGWCAQEWNSSLHYRPALASMTGVILDESSSIVARKFLEGRNQV